MASAGCLGGQEWYNRFSSFDLVRSNVISHTFPRLWKTAEAVGAVSSFLGFLVTLLKQGVNETAPLPAQKKIHAP